MMRVRANMTDPFPESLQRFGIAVSTLRQACVTGSGLPVWTLSASGDPFDAWRRLRGLHGQTGLWPFLTGSKNVARLWEAATEYHDPTALERGLSLDAERFLFQRAAFIEAPRPEDVKTDPIRRGPEVSEPTFEFTSSNTVVGLIQAKEGYEIPGLLSWSGALNIGLDGANHVAVLSYWHERYGAELVTLAPDGIELLVPRPPLDASTIARVAIEMGSYCPDLLLSADFEELAREYVPRRSWSFWWD